MKHPERKVWGVVKVVWGKYHCACNIAYLQSVSNGSPQIVEVVRDNLTQKEAEAVAKLLNAACNE